MSRQSQTKPKQPRQAQHSPTATSTKHKNKGASNQVRIIGGKFKRRNISFIDADGLRPTPDRLRETLFNWLMGHCQDAKVLDICAGSGVLSFECLSRGATFATLIEKNSRQAQMLKQSADTLKLGKNEYTLISGDAQNALQGLDTAYDLIFLDPPYADNLWQTLLQLVIDRQLYHAGSLLYIESDRPLNDIIGHFELSVHKQAKIGQIHAALLRFHDTEK